MGSNEQELIQLVRLERTPSHRLRAKIQDKPDHNEANMKWSEAIMLILFGILLPSFDVYSDIGISYKTISGARTHVNLSNSLPTGKLVSFHLKFFDMYF